jgi:hypothetical protein
MDAERRLEAVESATRALVHMTPQAAVVGNVTPSEQRLAPTVYIVAATEMLQKLGISTVVAPRRCGNRAFVSKPFIVSA